MGKHCKEYEVETVNENNLSVACERPGSDRKKRAREREVANGVSLGCRQSLTTGCAVGPLAEW